MPTRPVLTSLPEIESPTRADGTAAVDGDQVVWDATLGRLVASAGITSGNQYTLAYGWGDQSAVVLVGAEASLPAPWAGTIIGWTDWTDDGANVTADFDIMRSAAVDPPVFASLVGAGTKPFLTGQRWRTGTPTGWTSVAVAAGDIIAPVVNSTGGVAKSLRLQLVIQRT